jgi:exonuclease-1
VLKQIPKALKMSKLPINHEYIESFKKADNTFKYQVVFDPLQRKLVSITPYGSDVQVGQDLTYAG